MKNERMLKVMGQIDDSIVAEYMDSMQKTPAAIPHRSRVLLAAAIAALMILLMGCAWAVLHMENLKIGEETISEYLYDENGEGLGYQDITHNILATGGIKGSPNYLAAAEWYAFMQEFDPHSDIANAYYSRTDVETFPEEYSAYWPYDQKMVDKLDELAEKYDLKLLGAVQQFQDPAEFLNAVGISGVLRENGAVRWVFQNGHRYEGGNFGCVFELEPMENKQEWPDFLYGSFKYYRKDNLDTQFWRSREMPDSEEWNYTTKSGQNLLVISTPSDYGNSIFCNREEGTIVLMLSTLQKPQGDVLSTALTKKQVEAILDSIVFDF